jgi:hypothetical protein
MSRRGVPEFPGKLYLGKSSMTRTFLVRIALRFVRFGVPLCAQLIELTAELPTRGRSLGPVHRAAEAATRELFNDMIVLHETLRGRLSGKAYELFADRGVTLTDGEAPSDGSHQLCGILGSPVIGCAARW